MVLLWSTLPAGHRRSRTRDCSPGQDGMGHRHRVGGWYLADTDSTHVIASWSSLLQAPAGTICAVGWLTIPHRKRFYQEGRPILWKH
jgi:hypothetical protein